MKYYIPNLKGYLMGLNFVVDNTINCVIAMNNVFIDEITWKNYHKVYENDILKVSEKGEISNLTPEELQIILEKIFYEPNHYVVKCKNPHKYEFKNKYGFKNEYLNGTKAQIEYAETLDGTQLYDETDDFMFFKVGITFKNLTMTEPLEDEHKKIVDNAIEVEINNILFGTNIKPSSKFRIQIGDKIVESEQQVCTGLKYIVEKYCTNTLMTGCIVNYKNSLIVINREKLNYEKYLPNAMIVENIETIYDMVKKMYYERFNLSFSISYQ